MEDSDLLTRSFDLREQHVSAHTIMDLFANSPFWDSASNNAIIRMQNLSTPLEGMDGIEFQLVQAHEPYFYLIVKQHREVHRSRLTPLAYYYCLDGILYQAPDLGSVFKSSVVRCADFLLKSWEECSQHVEYDVSIGRHRWTPDDAKKEKEEIAEKEEAKKKEQQTVDLAPIHADVLWKLDAMIRGLGQENIVLKQSVDAAQAAAAAAAQELADVAASSALEAGPGRPAENSMENGMDMS